MTAQATVIKTADGWDVYATDAEYVHVTTSGPTITVSVTPDEDEATPLDVTLATSTGG